MKILQVTQHVNVGGAEAVAENNHITFEKLNLVITTMGLRGNKKSVRIFDLYNRKSIFLFNVIRKIATYDVIIVHSFSLLLVLFPILWLFGKHTIFIVHFNYSANKIRLIKIITGLLKAYIVATSAYSLNLFKNSTNLFHINNYARKLPPDFENSYGISEFTSGRNIIAFIGKFKKGKRIIDIAKLSNFVNFNKYCIVIFGSGPEQQLFDDELKINGVKKEGNILMIDNCEAPTSALLPFRGDTTLFLPSYNSYEMESMVLIEAGVAKIKTVSWDLPAISGLVSHQVEFQNFTRLIHLIESGDANHPPIYDQKYALHRWRLLLSLFEGHKYV